MDFELAILLLVIGILSIVFSAYYIAKELIKLKRHDKILKAAILTNVGANNASNLKEENLFTVSEKDTGNELNSCDIKFDSDLHMLNQRTYSCEFILTLAKDKV